MPFFRKIYFFLRNQSEIRLEFQKITLFYIPLLIFDVYLNCMNMLGDVVVFGTDQKGDSLKSVTPPLCKICFTSLLRQWQRRFPQWKPSF